MTGSPPDAAQDHRHPGIVREIAHVPMRDGVVLSVRICRPQGSGASPCILEYTPYRKSSSLLESFSSLVDRDYAIVSFDVRGTGDSAGFNESVYSDQERQDGYDLVEWCASQAWCNGNVGMWGISYGAVVSLQTARAAPPHLKAIIARSGNDDPFAEWTNPGGSPRTYMYEMYAPFMTARNFAPPLSAEWGAEWESLWKSRLEHSVPWGLGFVENLHDSKFWRDRAIRGEYHRVRCPVYVVDGWADWYPTPMLGIYAALQVPKRALIGPWSHQWPHKAIPGPRIDWEREAFKWWDHWLKGIDTGIMSDPPVTLFVREYTQPSARMDVDRGSFRCEWEWPIARTDRRVLFLSSGGALRTLPPGANAGSAADSLKYDPSVGICTGKHGGGSGGPFKSNCLMPLDQREDEAKSLTYTTAPLPHRTVIIGQPRVSLYISSSEDVGHVVVKLCDVAPDGTSLLVTKAFRNLAYRNYPAEVPSAIEAGRVYAVDIDLLACAYAVEAGHRLRVVVSGADFLNIWPMSKVFTSTIYHDGEHPSCLSLPIVDSDATPAAQPSIRLIPGDLVVEPDPGSFTVTWDIVTDLMSYQFHSNYFGIDARFQVSLRDPAQASVRAEATFDCVCDGRKIETRALCITSSDSSTFSHEIELTALVDGKSCWAKRWSKVVPRGFC